MKNAETKFGDINDINDINDGLPCRAVQAMVKREPLPWESGSGALVPRGSGMAELGDCDAGSPPKECKRSEMGKLQNEFKTVLRL